MLATILLLQAAGAVLPADICRQFESFDHNGDGQVEIAHLRLVDDKPPAGMEGKHQRVLILVEDRLLQSIADGHDLHPHLSRLRDDLSAEGFAPITLSVDLAESDVHQDGRFVLALREVLRAFDADHRLGGALLVGHFPDAYLVRTCNWRRKGDITLHQQSERQTMHKDAHYLRRVPEHVSQRADIVLADLDGHWENLYVQPRTQLASTIAVFDGPIPGAGGACIDLEETTGVFEDYFHISDGKLEVQRPVRAEQDKAPTPFGIFLDDDSGDHECTAEDLTRPNGIARPDIFVSRIDAWGTAQSPRAGIMGASGEGLLDASGFPQSVTFADEASVPHWRDDLWCHDPLLERRLIAEHLDRNHGFRRGTAPVAWRPASIAHDLGSGFKAVAAASKDWSNRVAAMEDIHGRPSLESFVEWMNYAAVVRTIRAHSSSTVSLFGRPDMTRLEELAGASPWSWTRRGNRLEPSLSASSKEGRLDWFLLRTLWENGATAKEPSFYLHTGCEGISPPESRTRPYTDPDYGVRQGAEALLMMGRGLALLGRAKVFYDEPRGFAEELEQGGTIGAAWARYFDIESRSTWDRAGGDIGRKRSYFWSVLGDWTLRLRMAKPAPSAKDRGVETSRWEEVELADSRLFIPEGVRLGTGPGNEPARSHSVPLYIHFQGGVSAARDNFVRMERDGVLLTSTLSGFSSAFSTPYEDPAAFGSLLDSVEAALTERAGHPVHCGPIVITFFSAGYGAVRELLKHPAHYDRIDALVSADSIYASVVTGTVRAPEATQMVDFQRFAQAAARGEKTFVLVHGNYATPYASTAECADLLLASVAAERIRRRRENDQGFSTASEAHVGNFHLYTFDVDAPYIHVQCMRMIPELIRAHL